MKIYFCRHGETTGDVEDRYGGDYDDHLTGLGLQQSKKLAEQLTGKGIEKIFVSPLIRAQETARMVADKLVVEFETAPGFKERNSYGMLTSMVKSEAREKYPDQVNLLKDPHNTIEGAETYSDFQKRITDALSALSKEPYHTVAIITHGGPMSLLFRDILKLGEIEKGDCSYALMEESKGRYSLLEMHNMNINQ